MTAVDASLEMIAVCREKVDSPDIRFVQADIFMWEPDKTYDLVFFSFWLSHVPPERLQGFLRTLRGALRPRGKIFFVDSLAEGYSTARDHAPPDPKSTRSMRRLKDGREFEIVKVFYEPDRPTEEFARAGLEVSVEKTSTYFIYGCGRPRPKA